MQLLVEVQVKDSVPVNGTWKVPSLSVVDLMPIMYLLDKQWERGIGKGIEWTEESVFRATKGEGGEIRIEFPTDVDADLLRFCITRVIDGMIRAVVDTAWMNEVYARIKAAKEGELWTPPSGRGKGPLKL